MKEESKRVIADMVVTDKEYIDFLEHNVDYYRRMYEQYMKETMKLEQEIVALQHRVAVDKKLTYTMQYPVADGFELKERVKEPKKSFCIRIKNLFRWK